MKISGFKSRPKPFGQQYFGTTEERFKGSTLILKTGSGSIGPGQYKHEEPSISDLRQNLIRQMSKSTFKEKSSPFKPKEKLPGPGDYEINEFSLFKKKEFGKSYQSAFGSSDIRKLERV